MISSIKILRILKISILSLTSKENKELLGLTRQKQMLARNKVAIKFKSKKAATN